MLKKTTFYLSFIFACIVVANAQPKANKYGVITIADINEYKELVAKDSAKTLVELTRFIPDIKLDIRYATSNNFMGQPMYKHASPFLSRPAATALRSGQKDLKQLGYGLKVFDAYRPYSITVAFYEKVHDTVFVASPYRGSRHNRGCAIDLTLIALKTGEELPMPTSFDDFTEKAHSNYPNLPTQVIKNRELLKAVMTKNGFEIYADEWWHYDFKGWRDHPLLDVSFDDLRNF